MHIYIYIYIYISIQSEFQFLIETNEKFVSFYRSIKDNMIVTNKAKLNKVS